MSTTSPGPTVLRPSELLHDLVKGHCTLGPNWYASVMGTAIVANAAASLPLIKAQLHPFAVVVWILSVCLLVVLTAVVAATWIRNPRQVLDHLCDPVMAQFYGAPPMALMTVGGGAVLVGRSVIGLHAAVDVDWVLWILGTIGGLLAAATIPFLLFTRFDVRHDGAFGGWLMPVVPPMVSAANGALLIGHVSSPTGRATLLYGCYAMFGLSLIAALIIITLIWSRLALHGSSGTARVPTLWIVLGPLGQSITAAGLLGSQAHTAVPAALAGAYATMAVLFGVPVFGFVVLWAALAAAITARTIRRGLPFALTWWSFTFPVGTCVTGANQLTLHTDLPAFRWIAVVAYGGLLTAWLIVALRTIRGSYAGDLFVMPTAAAAPVSQKS